MEKFFVGLEKVFITTPLLTAISQGKFFTKAFAWLLRICAALAAIAFIYFSVTLWINFAHGGRSYASQLANAFGDGNSVGVFFVFLFAQLLAIPLFYVIVNIFLIRSNRISKLPLQTDYVVIPVAVQLIKMMGEIIAVFIAIGGVFVTLALLVTGTEAGNVFEMIGIGGPRMMMGGSFGGYFSFITGPIIGFLVLVFFYSLAELVGALVDIARNTKKK